MKTELIIQVLALAAEHGVPAVKAAIIACNKDEITAADLKELAEIKSPESYFETK